MPAALDAIEIDRDLAALLRGEFARQPALHQCTKPTRSQLDFIEPGAGCGSGARDG